MKRTVFKRENLTQLSEELLKHTTD